MQDVTESDAGDESLNNAKAAHYAIREEPEEYLEEAAPQGEQGEDGAGTPSLLKSQVTIRKAVTKKLSTKGRCRVLTIVEGMVDESDAEANPLTKVVSVP